MNKVFVISCFVFCLFFVGIHRVLVALSDVFHFRIYVEEEDDTSALFIKDIVLDDSGYYTCRSGNLYQAVFLSVNGILCSEMITA